MPSLSTLGRAGLRVTAMTAKAVLILALALTLALIAACQPWPSSAAPGGYLQRLSQQDLTMERAADQRALSLGAPALEAPPTGLWQLRAVRAQEAWAAIPQDAPRPRVGVYDGIIARGHPDLEPNFLVESTGGWDGVAVPDLFIHGHGTAIMGITAGAGLPGMTGVAPRAHLVPAHTLGPSGLDMPGALAFFAQHGARLANFAIALGGPIAGQNDVDEAYHRGVLIITGLYNSDVEAIAYPAAHLRTVTASGIDEHDRLMGYGWGPLLDLVAPATGILSTGPVIRLGDVIFGPRYIPLCCNSAATAIVTGVGALVLERDPTLTSEQLEKRLKLAARKLPEMGGARWHPRYGYGATDAYAAVTYDRTGPAVTIAQFATLPNDMRGIGGIAKDTTDDGALQPGRERDRHLAGVPISNIAGVEYRIGTGPWRPADFLGEPDRERSRPFSVRVPVGTPTLTIRARDTAGNLGDELEVTVP